MWVPVVMAIGFSVASTQSPNGKSVEKLDPALDAIVSPNAKVEVLKADYFGNAEGPVWVKEGQSGHLLLTDVSANAIYKWTPDGKLSVFLERTGFNSTDTSSLQTAGYVGSYNGRFYPVSFGTSSVTLDRQGRVLWTAQGDRAVVRLEKDGKTRTVLADHYEGKRLNRPNDLAVKADGWVYFTDPHSNNRGAAQEFPGRVYRVKDGKVELLVDNITPNGIAFSPDEKYLYIGGSKLLRYDVQPDGTTKNGKEVNSVGCDGIKVDLKGNIYCATAGESPGVRIFSPEGKHLGTILTPHDDKVGPTNLAFGDADGKTLYITIKRTLARIRLNTTGFRSN